MSEPKLKLGKGVAFVKSQLRRLPQSKETWEGDIRPALGNNGTIWAGMVISHDGWFLSERTFEEPATVNDLARILADAMLRPLDGNPRRPRTLRLRKRFEWEELLPHLEQLGIRVVSAARLAKWDHVFKEFCRKVLRSKPAPEPPAVEEPYPTIPEFVRTQGHIEIGDQRLVGFVARALDCGGLVFEARKVEILGEAMAALDAGLADRLKRESCNVRRPPTDAELAALFNAAREGQPFRGISGEDREMLYRFALAEGLRAGELASLTPESIRLTANPTLTVAAAYSKHRREDTLPIHPDLVERVRRWLPGKRPGQPLWPGSWKWNAALMLRGDLEKAGIPYQLEDCFLDFHAQRHGAVTRGAKSMKPKELQKFARHSNIQLTLGVYTHLESEELASAVANIPALPAGTTIAPGTQQKATGTNGEANGSTFSLPYQKIRPSGGQKWIPNVIGGHQHRT